MNKSQYPPHFSLELQVADINNMPIAKLWIPSVEGYAPLREVHDLYAAEDDPALNGLRIRVETWER